jgi:asparagine synthase (glutamine-hydrolysing)
MCRSGVLCSGGLDSSLIAALAAGEIDELNTFCVAFGEDGFDDSPFARMVSERYRTDHHELVVGPEDYATELAEAVWMNDEPLAHGHESQLLGIAKMAKERVTVLLSGEGADELFGGYGRYDLAGYGHFLTSRPGRVIGRVLTPIMRGRWSRRVDKLLAHTQMSQDDSILFNSSGVLRSHLDHLKWDWEGRFPYRRAVLDEIQRAGARRMSVAMLYDQAIFIPSLLDRNDKMTMGASIECRVPFLNHRLVEQANNLPSTWKRHRGVGKRVLRDRLGTLLPQPLLDRSKVGFGVPMGGWFRRSETLKRMVSDLCRGDFVRMGIFSASAVSSLVDRHLRGDEELGGILWNLLALELWHSETRSRLATSAKSVSSVP